MTFTQHAASGEGEKYLQGRILFEKEHVDCCEEKQKIFTFTDTSFFTEVVPMGTFTLKTAKSIDTVSTLAETRQFLTFINVCNEREGHVF